jgi:predicted PurR-regulated permease PerM
VLQALLAGIGMIVAGIPAATLLTSAVLIFCIIQIGAWIVLIPVVVWSWTAMDIVPALVLTVYLIPVNFLEYILRPIVVARGL